MNTVGLWMLGTLAVTIVLTGLPVWALLVGVAGAFAGLGLASGVFDSAILSALPPRIVNLLEHDLLQAMPLYVFVGMLLQRLPLADALFATATRLFRPLGAAPSLAGLAVGTLIAPMNGSVASSSALLSRLVAPRLHGLAPAKSVALVSVAATVGVVVPPSLVLILLGDAMLRAHTEASNLPGFVLGTQRIVNTQDVLHAALVPAACLLLLWSVIAWLQGRKPCAAGSFAAGAHVEATRAAPTASAASSSLPESPGAPGAHGAFPPPVSRTQIWTAAAVTTVILLLLGGVFAGRFFAVEAAATGGCLLAVAALVTRALNRAQWRDVLVETLALSGALFALLVGATTFSLVFRLFATDRWLADLVLGSPWPHMATAAAVLLLVALCAWVLDAFEMIFVVIPILAPALIARLGDAQQTAVLLLLVLQLSFLLPPMGYAVLMVRARSGLPQVRTAVLMRALAPFIAAQLLVAVLVFAVPGTVHLLDDTAVPARHQLSPASDQDIVRQMEEMARQPAAVTEPDPKP